MYLVTNIRSISLVITVTLQMLIVTVSSVPCSSVPNVFSTMTTGNHIWVISCSLLMRLPRLQMNYQAEQSVATCGHHSKPLDLFCETCEELICHDYTVKRHARPEHDYDLVSDAYDKQEKTIYTESLIPLNEHFHQLSEAKQIIIEEKEAIQQQVDMKKNEIQHIIAEIRHNLDETEKSLMEDVNNASVYKFGVLDHQVSEIDLALGQILECKNHIEHSLKKGIPRHVLLTKKQIVNHAQKMISNVKEKTFEPLEKPDIEVRKNDVEAVQNMHKNIAWISSKLTAISSSKLAFTNIPVAKHQSKAILSLVSPDGSLIPVPPSLIQCQLVPVN